MKIKNFNAFLLVLVLVLSLYFVLAVSLPPIDIIFEGNSTPVADSDGVFTINWTDGGQNVTGNYTIYLWMNGNYVSSTPNANTSALGYAWDNATEANYTFAISAVNTTNKEGINSSNVSMYVDATAPLVNWTNSGYNNVTYKKNTEKLTVNISVGDASSGLTNSYCVFNISNGTASGTNETIAVSDGWCNSTQLNLTGLGDGNHSINIYANDSANNVGVNLSTYVVWVDTTVPTSALTCTPTSVYATETITCSCNATDASSGVRNNSYTANPSTSATGSFSTSCNVTDNAGNSALDSVSYTVGGIKSSGTGTTASSVSSSWTGTYVINDEQFKEGYTKQLEVKKRIKFKVDNIDHQVGVLELTDTSVKIEVSSVPQEATLAVGDVRKFDVNEDGYYDVQVILNSLSEGKADLSLKSINELVTEVTETDEQTKEETAKAGETEIGKSGSFLKKWWFWLIVVLVVAGIGYSSRKRE